MCFKKPKPPQPTKEDIELEKELKEQREIRKAQLAKELADQKEDDIRAALMRAQGLFGIRSLIAGGKGGAGFFSRFSRITATRAARGSSSGGNSGPFTPTAPPIATSSGGSEGGGGGGAGGSSFRSLAFSSRYSA